VGYTRSTARPCTEKKREREREEVGCGRFGPREFLSLKIVFYFPNLIQILNQFEFE
jgi:hypothetical protein